MKSRKNRNHSRRNKKGGFFFSSPNVTTSTDCDVNNLSTLSTDTGDGQDPLIKMRTNYQKCCPKDFMGRKNSSSYCKQLNMNFDSKSNYQRDIAGYYGDETDVSKIKQTMNETAVPPQIEPSSSQKPWYKFWGGKKTRKNRKFSRKHRKYSRRR
jgi:hypothetical protein